MNTYQPKFSRRLSRRDLLRAGLAAGAMLSAEPAFARRQGWAQPKRGGILRVWGYDPPHFDPHLILGGKTHNTLSFVYSRLLRHKVGAGVAPGSFTIEPELAGRWDEPDETTYVFHLRRGVRWHNKPPVNGRELIAEDVKFTYDRFLTEKGHSGSISNRGPEVAPVPPALWASRPSRDAPRCRASTQEGVHGHSESETLAAADTSRSAQSRARRRRDAVR